MSKNQDLAIMANKLRLASIQATTNAGSGHPTSCMSCAEIMSTLFFSIMQPDDEFILSKGHAVPILWAAYAETGCIQKQELETLRKIDSTLEGHPTPKMPSIRVATGSLGQGLSAGVGMALAKKLQKNQSRIYVLLGDGECAEGSVWEATNTAAYYNLNNICAIVDVNRLGQSQPTMHAHNLTIYQQKFQAFGWNSCCINGHNITDLLQAFTTANHSKKPFVIIAKTFKGKGFSEVEDKEGWHGKPFNEEMKNKAITEIGPANITLPSKVQCHTPPHVTFTEYQPNTYTPGDHIATRVAFGNALVTLGEKNPNVVAIDADVQNSVMTQDFFKTFPDRGFQSFIAEQNMVGMAIGLSAQGYIPYVATFATFLTRAHDFIRMAMYSLANVKFVGSHAGVSIGPDGPSQMGLEDIPMFLNLPQATVVYPSDAVSTEYLVKEITKKQGICYLRTTREKTPVIYEPHEKFPLGKLKVIRKSDQDMVLIISAGITLHEALKAYEILKNEGIYLRIIDLYCLQPLDSQSLIANSKACNNQVIVVEDHYCNALGSLISTILPESQYLCVTGIPRSGSPEELRSMFKIDSSAIIEMAKQFVKH